MGIFMTKCMPITRYLAITINATVYDTSYTATCFDY